MGQQKIQMKIILTFVEVSVLTPVAGEFYFQWKRGPQEDMTKNYYFGQNNDVKKLVMEDKFERISGFYKDKNGKFQKKTCEFKLMVGAKTKSRVSFDMSSQIGDKNEPIVIKMNDNISIKVIFKIIPSNQKLEYED